MSLLNRKQIILAKMESTYGTDPVPVGADAILVSDVSIAPLVAGTEERANLKPYLGNNAAIHVGEHVTLSFKTEIAGSGAAGTAPAWGKLLRACGFAETLTALTDAIYTPVSALFESATLYFNLDGQLHKLTGARGTASYGFDANKLPMLSFNFTGQFNAPSSVAAVTPDFTAFKIPEPAGKGHTGQFTLGAWAGVPVSLEVDVANSVTYHQTLTTNEIIIEDRKTAGKLTVEAPVLSSKNLFTEALANTTSALSIQHGQTAGNIVVVDAPNTQILQPNYGELNGVATVEMGLLFIPGNAGDDEISITVK